MRQRAGLARGDRVLAAALAQDGTWLLGTRNALVLVGTTTTTRLAWERVDSADWDRDLDRLRVTEASRSGQPAPVEHAFVVADPGRLLGLVRERVTASLLLTRRVVVSGRQGLTVLARRPPSGLGATVWTVRLDPGLDPGDPAVAEAADRGLRAARDELGESD